MAEVSYEVRVMKKNEIRKLLEVWTETEYPEGIACLNTWYEVDPQGFYVAVTDSGEVLGGCSAVVHHDDMAFVGLYCVRKKYRGLGIGINIWESCLEHIGNRNGSLNAVPGKLELYRDKGGFPVVEENRASVVNITHEDVNPELLSDSLPSGVAIKPLNEQNVSLVLEYDSKLAGYNREVAVRASIKELESASYVALQDGKCVGYGIIKLSVDQTPLLGPLYAEDAQIAEALMRKLLEFKPKGSKGFSVPTFNSNQAANDLLSKLGMPKGYECPICHTKHLLDIDTSKVFAQFDMNFTHM